MIVKRWPFRVHPATPRSRSPVGVLGRWFVPVAVVAFAYAAAIIVIALTPQEGHTAALYLLGAEVVGVLWYLLYLRSRITNQSAGVYRQEVVELEKSAEASPPNR